MTNFYDRIAHPITSQAYQHFGMQSEYLLVLFSTIQMIKIFLRTLYGISIDYYTSTQLFPFQGGI